MTVIHIILMAPYIQTNNEELYLYSNDVTCYVITCNSAFEYNNDVTYYVITRNYQWTEILTNNLLEAGWTNKLCPFQKNTTPYIDELEMKLQSPWQRVEITVLMLMTHV